MYENILPIEEPIGAIGDDVRLRDLFVISFFHRHEVPEIGAVINEILDEWLDYIPDDTELHYYSMAAEYPKPLKKAMLTRIKKGLEDEKYRNKLYSVTLLSYPDNAPEFYFRHYSTSLAKKKELGWIDTVNYTEIYLPTSMLYEKTSREGLINWVHSIAERLDNISGYASIGLGGYAPCSEHIWCEYLPRYLFRYPGLDLVTNDVSSGGIGNYRCKGARWLTFLGEKALKRLGGEGMMKSNLTDDIGLSKAGKGVMIRASDVPELGDMNREGVPASLKTIAKAIEPVTLFNSNAAQYLSCDENDWEDAVQRWERRFWID